MTRLTALILFSAMAASAQTTDPVIRVDVDLRQVDLVVDDAKGRHVTDLQAEDFQIFEDGRPQKLSNFSWIEVTPPPRGAILEAFQEKPSLMEKFSGVARFRKTPGNDIVAAPVANPRKEQIRRTIVFVVNNISMPVIDRLRKFIDEQVAPGDMISIRSTLRSVIPKGGTETIRDSMGIFQQFTNDRRQLDAATERLPRTCDFINRCIPDVPGTLIAAIRSLSNVPGRKAVVFVGGYRGPVENVVNLANRAGVVINVLNPAGTPLNAMVEGFPGAESVVDLAKHTGGRWLLSTGGFDTTSDLNNVMEDLSGYYLLGYHPDSASNMPLRPKIEVKVLRAGLVVRARNGIIGTPGAVANTVAKPKSRDEMLTDAMFSAFTADGIRVHLNPVFAASPPNAKTGKRSPIVRAILDIDGHDVTFAEAESGEGKMVLDVAVAVFNADGTQAGAKNQTFNVTGPREKMAMLAKTSLQYKMDLPLANGGPYQVRTAVRDAASGVMGSAYAYLDIPDFNAKKISLSSLTLALPDGVTAQPIARTSWNEFAAGTAVQFGCEVFGLKTVGKPAGPPRVDLEVRLYRGGGPVVDVSPVAARIESVGGPMVLGGSLQIPGDLAPGNYAMEVIAYDRLEPEKKQTATQWIDLTVVRPGAPE